MFLSLETTLDAMKNASFVFFLFLAKTVCVPSNRPSVQSSTWE